MIGTVIGAGGLGAPTIELPHARQLATNGVWQPRHKPGTLDS